MNYSQVKQMTLPTAQIQIQSESVTQVRQKMKEGFIVKYVCVCVCVCVCVYTYIWLRSNGWLLHYNWNGFNNENNVTPRRKKILSACKINHDVLFVNCEYYDDWEKISSFLRLLPFTNISVIVFALLHIAEQKGRWSMQTLIDSIIYVEKIS
jgi:hypothetical protein